MLIAVHILALITSGMTFVAKLAAGKQFDDWCWPIITAAWIAGSLIRILTEGTR